MWNRFAKRTKNIPNTTAAQAIKKGIAAEKAKGHEVICMEIGTPNFDTPEYIKKAAIDSIEAGDVFYSDSHGILELRQAIADKLRRDNNLDYTADEILVTCGGTEGLYVVLSALCDEGDEVIFCDPIWDSYVGCAKYFGVKTVYYHLKEENDYQVSYEELSALITERTKLIVVVSPNNPQGSLYTRESLETIAKVAQESDLLVLSDEMYDKIIYDDVKLTSIATLPNMKERTITLNGFSKTFSMTGWRMGYLAAPNYILHELYKIHARILSCLPVFCQKGAAEAVNNIEEYDKAVKLMVDEYRRRRDYLVEHLNAIPGLSCRKPEGAFYLFLNVKGLGMDSETAQKFLLEEAHVATTQGVKYGDGTSDGYIRMCYAVSMDDIKKACENIKHAVEKYLANKN